jgi:hypothetical protein
MPNSYKTAFVELNQTTNPTTALRATASTTLVKQVYFSHADHQAVVELYFTDNETGSSAVLVNKVTAPLGEMTPLLNDVMALESGQILSVKDNQSTTGDESYVTVVYVENVTAVNGQSIDVLNDVDTTTALPSTGDVLTWDGNQWEPQAGGGGAVDSVNGQTGVVVLDMDDIDDVDAAAPFGGDVLQWTGLAWEPSGKLNLLYSLLKEGADTSIKNGGGTDSELKLESTKATVSTGITKVVLTETSPGDIEFIVATDSSGTTAFTALHIDGLTAANEANIIVKQGAFFKFDDGLYTQWIRPTSGNTADTVAILPDSSGQLALTTDLYTDSDADARIAAASVTDLTDVSSAGSGAIITTAERTKLTGIATGATLNSPDSILLDRAYHTGTQTASTISDFDTEVSNNTSVTANTAKVGYTDSAVDARIAAASFLDLSDAPASYDANELVVVNGTATGLTLTSKRLKYSDSEVVDDQNRIFDVSQTGGTDTVRDFMNDTAASASSSSAKNFLGWWDGTTLTIEGMVNTNAQPPQGATAGAPLWLGTSGAISAAAPTTATHYSRIIGYHIGTDQGGDALIYFKPSPDWVEIS